MAINAVINFFNRLRVLSEQHMTDDELLHALLGGDMWFWRGQLDKVKGKANIQADVDLLLWYEGTVRPFMQAHGH